MFSHVNEHLLQVVSLRFSLETNFIIISLGNFWWDWAIGHREQGEFGKYSLLLTIFFIIVLVYKFDFLQKIQHNIILEYRFNL